MLKIKILFLFLLIGVTTISAQTYSGGSGTAANPYLISSKADMEIFAGAVNSGSTYAGMFFRLTQSLTGSNALTTSVGSIETGNTFQGIFDGGGFEIELSNVEGGLFDYIYNAIIQNVGVSGTVTTPVSSGNFYAGGISARAENSKIYNSHNSATVSTKDPTDGNYHEGYIGGICGYAYYSEITYCYNTGIVSSFASFSGLQDGGGIAGVMINSTVSNCFNFGQVSGLGSNYNIYFGGIIGYAYGDNNNIANSYNAGKVSAITNAWAIAGGICGMVNNPLSIINCFSASASIEAKNNDGDPTGSAGRIEGFDYGASTFSNVYALSTLLVNGSTVSSADATSKDGADASLSNFRLQSWIQSTLGWDFSTVWQMSATGSAFQGFPALQNTPPPVYFTITAQAANNGSISPSGGSQVAVGGSKTYTFTPNAGFQISQVLIDGGNNYDAVSSGAYTFTDVSKSHTINVYFSLLTLPAFSGGSGTAADPYRISTKADMVALANAVEGGTTYAGLFFRLTQNLTGANAVTTSVGYVNTGLAFQGIFDGGGFEIELNHVEGGLFGYLYNAIIQNLGVSGTVTASSASYFYAGGISAVAQNSKIYNCHNSATVSTRDYVYDSNNYHEGYIGGICGSANSSEIMYCYNTGTVSSSASFSASCYGGGIAGVMSNSTVSNCFNFGQASGLGSNSYNLFFGGIIGYAANNNTITNSYNAGNVSAVNGWPFAGGICGYAYNPLSIVNCFSASASIEAKNSGGYQNGQAGRIEGSDNSGLTFSNNYALSTLSVNGSTVNSSDATVKDGADASLSNFQSQSWIQSNLGWDFDMVWQMSAAGSSFQGFPTLQNVRHDINLTITANASKNGSISPSGDSPVAVGGSKTYTISPNAGFQIYQVMIDGGYNGDAVSSGTYTFTGITNSHTIEVFFQPLSPPAFSGGTGTQDAPYLISSKADMVALADAVEGGTTYEGKYFRLTQNLSGSEAVSTSVGNNYSSFNGIFDGRGYEIELDNATRGVFAYTYNATIQYLSVSGTVSGSSLNSSTGGVCGNSNNSTIAYCYNAATVLGYYSGYTGGICGQANYNTTIINSFNTGDILGMAWTGGICGMLQVNSSILNCYNIGNISTVNQDNGWTVAGGICGGQNGGITISNCFSANSSVEAKYSDGYYSGYIGRITGVGYDTNYVLRNNFALSSMSVNGSSVSSSDAADPNGKDALLGNFKTQTWIQNNLSWDFSRTWQMSASASANQGFPVFQPMINYVITASSDANGSISPSGDEPVTQGENQTFTFTPNTGYEIDQVLVDGTNNTDAVSAGSYTFTNVTTDHHTISVTFKLIQYTLSASAGTGGSISQSGDITVDYGSDQTFNFTPDTGYEIDQVIVDGNNNTDAVSAGSYTFTNITESHTIYVTFKVIQYTLSASAGTGGGSISPTGDVTISYGSDYSFYFYPDTGYEIDQVLVDGVNDDTAVSSRSYTFTNVTAVHSIYVTFKLIQYTLSVTAGTGGGSISPNSNVIINYGSDQTFYFYPDTGYEIDQVIIDGTTVASSGSYTFNYVTADHSIYVTFKLIPYTVSVSAVTSGGSISQSGDLIVNYGNDQTLYFYPDTGYEIDQVIIDGANNTDAVSSGSYTFTNVTAVHTVYVYFKLIPYTLSASAVTGGGSISPSGDVTVNYGDYPTFYFYPDTGYEIDQVLVDGVNDDTAVSSGSYTFNYVTANHTITVYFKLIPYTLSASAVTGGGSISPSGDVTVNYGDYPTFYFYPDTGYEIDQVLVDGVNDGTAVSTGNYTFNYVTSDHSISVIFKLIPYTVSVSAVTSGGSVSQSGDITVDYGNNSPTFYFYPDTGYEIDQVLVDGVNDDTAVSTGNYTFNYVTSDHSISVTFKLIPYTVSVSAVTGGGSISQSGDITVDYGGNSPTFYFYPDTGYEIDQVLVDGVNDGTAVSSGNYTFNYVTANHAITVYFKQIQYTVSVSAVTGGGSISQTGDITVDYGSNSPTFYFYPDTGYEIDQVLVDGVNDGTAVSSGSYTFNYVTAIHTITVYFKQIQYTVSVSAVTSGGSISQTGDVTVDYGSNSPTFYFYPDTGYEIDQVLVDGVNDGTAVSTGNYTFNYVTSDHTISVYFKQIQYTVSASAVTGGGSISPSGDITVDYGNNSPTFNIYPDTGYEIDQVLVDGVNDGTAVSTGNYTFNYVTSDHSISVTFKLIPYTVSVSAVTSGGSISQTGDITVDYGSNSPTFYFNPDTGYEIDQVIVDGVNDDTAVSTGSYTFNYVTSDHSISVTFKLIPYTVSVSAVTSGGSISQTGDVTVDYGSNSPTFYFYPDTGYEIDQVLVDGVNDGTAVSTGNYTFNYVTSDHSITVYFKLIPYTLSASAVTGGGSISPSGDVIASYGDSPTFYFYPDTGYEIDQVLVDGVNDAAAVSSGSYTFTNVTANHTISVSFKQTPVSLYTINASAGSGGSISPSGSVSVNQGDSKTFTFSPNTNYLIDNVLVDGVGNASAIASGSYTFTNVTANHTISVSFKPECLPNIIVQIWDDVLSVINVPANNGGYTFTAYQWLKNGVEIPGETSGNLYLTNDADKKAMSQFSCRVTTSTGQTLESCPSQISVKSGVSAYPNPTEGTVIIESSALKEGDKIDLYNSTGTFVKQYLATPIQTTIELGNQPKGLYILQVNGQQVKIILL